MQQESAFSDVGGLAMHSSQIALGSNLFTVTSLQYEHYCRQLDKCHHSFKLSIDNEKNHLWINRLIRQLLSYIRQCTMQLLIVIVYRLRTADVEKYRQINIAKQFRSNCQLYVYLSVIVNKLRWRFSRPTNKALTYLSRNLP